MHSMMWTLRFSVVIFFIGWSLQYPSHCKEVGDSFVNSLGRANATAVKANSKFIGKNYKWAAFVSTLVTRDSMSQRNAIKEPF